MLDFHLLKPKHLMGTIWYYWSSAGRSTTLHGTTIQSFITCLVSCQFKTLGVSTAHRTQVPWGHSHTIYEGKLLRPHNLWCAFNIKPGILRTLVQGNLNLIFLLMFDCCLLMPPTLTTGLASQQQNMTQIWHRQVCGTWQDAHKGAKRISLKGHRWGPWGCQQTG